MLGYVYLDSGAMYRAVALKAIERKISLENEIQLVNLARETHVELKPPTPDQEAAGLKKFCHLMLDRFGCKRFDAVAEVLYGEEEPLIAEGCDADDVEAGVALVKASMMDDVDGVPRLRVFRSCTNFLKEIRMYRRIKDNSSDKHERNAVPVKRDDHLLDTLRYMELGGIRYVAPPDPFFTREATDEQLQPPGFKASMPMEKLIEENWKRLMKLQSQPRAETHFSGIGSEF